MKKKLAFAGVAGLSAVAYLKLQQPQLYQSLLEKAGLNQQQLQQQLKQYTQQQLKQQNKISQLQSNIDNKFKKIYQQNLILAKTYSKKRLRIQGIDQQKLKKDVERQNFLNKIKKQQKTVFKTLKKYLKQKTQFQIPKVLQTVVKKTIQEGKVEYPPQLIQQVNQFFQNETTNFLQPFSNMFNTIAQKFKILSQSQQTYSMASVAPLSSFPQVQSYFKGMNQKSSIISKQFTINGQPVVLLTNLRQNNVQDSFPSLFSILTVQDSSYVVADLNYFYSISQANPYFNPRQYSQYILTKPQFLKINTQGLLRLLSNNIDIKSNAQLSQNINLYSARYAKYFNNKVLQRVQKTQQYLNKLNAAQKYIHEKLNRKTYRDNMKLAQNQMGQNDYQIIPINHSWLNAFDIKIISSSFVTWGLWAIRKTGQLVSWSIQLGLEKIGLIIPQHWWWAWAIHWTIMMYKYIGQTVLASFAEVAHTYATTNNLLIQQFTGIDGNFLIQLGQALNSFGFLGLSCIGGGFLVFVLSIIFSIYLKYTIVTAPIKYIVGLAKRFFKSNNKKKFVQKSLKVLGKKFEEYDQKQKKIKKKIIHDRKKIKQQQLKNKQYLQKQDNNLQQIIQSKKQKLKQTLKKIKNRKSQNITKQINKQYFQIQKQPKIQQMQRNDGITGQIPQQQDEGPGRINKIIQGTKNVFGKAAQYLSLGKNAVIDMKSYTQNYLKKKNRQKQQKQQLKRLSKNDTAAWRQYTERVNNIRKINNPYYFSILGNQLSKKKCWGQRQFEQSVGNYISKQQQKSSTIYSFKNTLLQLIDKAKQSVSQNIQNNIGDLFPFIFSFNKVPIQISRGIIGLNKYPHQIQQWKFIPIPIIQNQIVNVVKKCISGQSTQLAILNQIVEGTLRRSSYIRYFQNMKVPIKAFLQELNHLKSYGDLLIDFDYLQKCAMKVRNKNLIMFITTTSPKLRFTIQQGKAYVYYKQKNGQLNLIQQREFNHDYLKKMMLKKINSEAQWMIDQFNKGITDPKFMANFQRDWLQPLRAKIYPQSN